MRDSISSVRDAIFIGLVLACIILFLFLRDWTSSLIAGLVIPVTVAVTILVLWAIGQSFNLMTLGGLAAAIGLVIDDAIVVVENIVMHRDPGEPRSQAVRKALSEITVPADRLHHHAGRGVSAADRSHRRHGQLLPRAGHHHGGVAADFADARADLDAGPEPRAVARARQAMRAKHNEHTAGRLLSRVLSVHHRVLDWALAKPLWLGVACLLLVIATYFGYRALGSDLLPEMDEGGFILDYIMPAGSSLTETNRVLEHVERILRSYAGSRKHLTPHRPADGSCRRY